MAGNGSGQGGNRVVVDPFPKPGGQIYGVEFRGGQNAGQRPSVAKGFGGEQQVQVSGPIGGEERQVQLHEGLRPALSAHSGVPLGGVEPDLGGSGEDYPVHVLLVGHRQAS